MKQNKIIFDLELNPKDLLDLQEILGELDTKLDRLREKINNLKIEMSQKNYET